jgi:hypothetical protein
VCFEAEEVAAVTDLFDDWGPRIYAKLLPELNAPTQVFNKTSRLGWPLFVRSESKKAALQPFFHLLLNDGPSFMRDAFIIYNVRLQAESIKKKRDFLFVRDDGDVYAKTVGADERKIRTPIGPRTASRTRLVFNLPVANLLNQVLDTAIHAALLAKPAFHHDMYSMTTAGKLSGTKLFFDVKHFERHTSGIVRKRATLIGGLYGDISAMFDSLPYLCPSDTRRSRQLLWPARDKGFTDQFASGNSAVAPAQKEVFWALYAEFATRAFGMDADAALQWVAGGGDNRLRIMNYGDDNATSGDPGVLRELLPFLGGFLHVEEEDPPKFLGFLDTELGWRLGVRSYLEKTYLNERAPGTTFRKYPCFGWVEKRKNYAKYGVPEITTQVFPTEDAVLYANAIPWHLVQSEATRESVIMRDLGGLADLNWILGKDYLMTPEEKLATGEFEGMFPDETGPIIRELLSTEWSKRLKW